MATFYRLTFVVGTVSPRLTEVDKSTIRSTPGAYTEVDRDTTNYYIVPATGAPRRATRTEAETVALGEFSLSDLTAHNMALANAARKEARKDGFEASPLDNIKFRTAADLLREFECDFSVVARDACYKVGDVHHDAVGFRATVREDNGVTLHMSTDAYEVVQSVNALNLFDRAAAKGEILYRYAWQSIESQRVRAVGAERGHNVEIRGRRVGIRFGVDGVKSMTFGSRIEAGGTLVTSHDGSTAIKATACLTFAGVTIFHVDVRSWRHSSQVAARLETGKDALDYLARATRGLVRDAEATVGVSNVDAANTVLRALAPELFEPVAANLDPKVTAELQKARDQKLTDCRLRLHSAAKRFDSLNEAQGIGGFAYVLAAPFFASNREVNAASYYDGLARERMTTALLALARFAGMVDAGIVPEAA